MIAIALLVFYAGSRLYGTHRTWVFLGGAILWTAPLENFAVAQHGYTYYGFANALLPGYPGYLLWVGLVPFWILLGWFVIALSCYVISHEVLLRGRRALVQASFSALLALNIDLLMDPIASANHLWIWTAGSFPFLGVPLFNFIGWFMLIFFFDIISNHTIFRNAPIRVISGVERILPRTEAAGSVDLRRLAIRIIILEILVIITLYFLANYVLV